MTPLTESGGGLELRVEAKMETEQSAFMLSKKAKLTSTRLLGELIADGKEVGCWVALFPCTQEEIMNCVPKEERGDWSQGSMKSLGKMEEEEGEDFNAILKQWFSQWR